MTARSAAGAQRRLHSARRRRFLLRRRANSKSNDFYSLLRTHSSLEQRTTSLYFVLETQGPRQNDALDIRPFEARLQVQLHATLTQSMRQMG